MNYIYIGEIVNTHGIKGEVRLICNFKYKEKIFIPGFRLYINTKKLEVIIKTYRKHKEYDMLTFEGYNNINDVLGFKGEKVYINSDDLVLDDNKYLNEDLIGMNVYHKDLCLGYVTDIETTNASDILVIKGEKQILIPYVDNFIESIKLNDKIVVKNVEGLI